MFHLFSAKVMAMNKQTRGTNHFKLRMNHSNKMHCYCYYYYYYYYYHYYYYYFY